MMCNVDGNIVESIACQCFEHLLYAANFIAGFKLTINMSVSTEESVSRYLDLVLVSLAQLSSFDFIEGKAI